MIVRRLPIVAVLLAAAAIGQDRPKYLLRLAIPAGQKLDEHVVHQTQITVGVGGNPLRLSIDFELFFVTSSAVTRDAKIQLNHEVVRVVVSGTTPPDENFAYDSAVDDEVPQPARRIADLVGATFVAIANDNGVVIRRELPAVVEQQDEDTAYDFMKPSDMLVPPALVFPDHPIAIGEKWQAKPVQREGIERTDTYLLLAVDGKRARIRRNRVSSYVVADKQHEDDGVVAEETFVVDIITGRILEYAATAEFRTAKQGPPISVSTKSSMQPAPPAKRRDVVLPTSRKSGKC